MYSPHTHARFVDPASLQHPPHRVLHPSVRPPAAATAMATPTSENSSASISTPPSPFVYRGNLATGTRKHITLDSLVPLDAPIQPRKYISPSATSRKDAFPQHQQHQQQQQQLHQRGMMEEEEEEDELVEDSMSRGGGGGCVVGEEQRQHIEWKRRQNTLAARKSRQRKLMHQMELEEAVKRLRAEKDTWKARAQMYEALLRSNGINVPELS